MDDVRAAFEQYERLCEEAQRSQVVYLPKEGYPLKQIEREAILQALIIARGSIIEAAKLLGLTAKGLRHKVRVVHQIPLPKHRKGLPTHHAP